MTEELRKAIDEAKEFIVDGSDYIPMVFCNLVYRADIALTELEKAERERECPKEGCEHWDTSGYIYCEKPYCSRHPSCEKYSDQFKPKEGGKGK